MFNEHANSGDNEGWKACSPMGSQERHNLVTEQQKTTITLFLRKYIQVPKGWVFAWSLKEFWKLHF